MLIDRSKKRENPQASSKERVGRVQSAEGSEYVGAASHGCPKQNKAFKLVALIL